MHENLTWVDHLDRGTQGLLHGGTLKRDRVQVEQEFNWLCGGESHVYFGPR